MKTALLIVLALAAAALAAPTAAAACTPPDAAPATVCVSPWVSPGSSPGASAAAQWSDVPLVGGGFLIVLACAPVDGMRCALPPLFVYSASDAAGVVYAYGVHGVYGGNEAAMLIAYWQQPGSPSYPTQPLRAELRCTDYGNDGVGCDYDYVNAYWDDGSGAAASVYGYHTPPSAWGEYRVLIARAAVPGTPATDAEEANLVLVCRGAIESGCEDALWLTVLDGPRFGGDHRVVQVVRTSEGTSVCTYGDAEHANALACAPPQ